MKSPILFLIFYRLEETRRVFEVIRRATPPRLYIASDGPSDSRPWEEAAVLAVRNFVMNHIDWDCDVKTLFREKNLGCKYAVSGGISWFFENEEMGIILEDDCLPHPSFFNFCEELLEMYRHDERIGIISGDNFQFSRRRTQDSYYFSRYAHIWGWASWRRVWKYYDVDLKLWPSIKNDNWLYDSLQNETAVKYWESIFNDVFSNKIDTWDYQLNFACWLNSMINIIPAINMISNIGFGANASRTTRKNKLSELPVNEMEFPLHHPPMMVRDSRADTLTERNQFRKASLINRISKSIIR